VNTIRQGSSKVPVIIEESDKLAKYLNVDKVTLVREDLLPGFGGKKRRSLDHFRKTISPGRRIHVLSYEGSHTVLTLSNLLPENPIILYGKSYSGGFYRKFMSQLVESKPNVTQVKGPLLGLLLKYYRARSLHTADLFMNFGGALGNDSGYKIAAQTVFDIIGNTADHFVPVASGDLLNSLRSTFNQVTGVLTQQWYLRLIQRIRLRGSTGIFLASIQYRENLVMDIFKKTGLALDPVFMGSVLAFCKRTPSKNNHICLWITCPGTVKKYLSNLLQE